MMRTEPRNGGPSFLKLMENGLVRDFRDLVIDQSLSQALNFPE